MIDRLEFVAINAAIGSLGLIVSVALLDRRRRADADDSNAARTPAQSGIARVAEITGAGIPTVLGLLVAVALTINTTPVTFLESVLAGLVVAGSFLSLVVYIGPLGSPDPLSVAAFSINIVVFGVVAWLAPSPLILSALLPLPLVSAVFALGWRIGLPLAGLGFAAWVVALVSGQATGNADVIREVAYTSGLGAALALAIAVSLEVGRRRQRQLIRRLSFDPVTTLHTRVQFELVFGQEFSRSVRFQRPLSVLMIDLDGMKGINDRLGHQTGDRLLRAAGEAIQRGIRRSDFAARFGGDEFVVLLPETDQVGAGVIAAVVQRNVSEIRVASGSTVAAGSASVGVATFPENGQTEAQLLAHADRMMYLDKRRRSAAR